MQRKEEEDKMKPCKSCVTPMKCKAAGKCLNKQSGKKRPMYK